jgi:ATP-dependent Clp protease ATP-binding subunit ClpA
MQADPALSRRFQVIHVPEPSLQEALEILEALRRAVSCAAQYSRNKLPDAAVDIMDEAAALCSGGVCAICPTHHE